MENDVVARNMMLSFEFSRYLIDHPEIEAQVPEGACVVLLPEDDPELCAYNRRICEEKRAAGQPVMYIRLSSLLPEQRSRIAGIRIEPAPVS
ncbi:MAG: hypothetical protein A3H49_01860 [Nitrospirae bacterium RIFCSPLOWO2_02_FULL_62_14]|nr:MAG: hypothetical protein A3H49_01860 [Nitrospirae bacterium RIFCSPLOWO2_02_FULL_62_14]